MRERDDYGIGMGRISPGKRRLSTIDSRRSFSRRDRQKPENKAKEMVFLRKRAMPFFFVGKTKKGIHTLLVERGENVLGKEGKKLEGQTTVGSAGQNRDSGQ